MNLQLSSLLYLEMYWPLGAPRVYAASRRRRKTAVRLNDDTEDGEEDEQASSAILGLRVSRNGLLFATITRTTLTVWQTSVCSIVLTISWF